MQTTRGRLVLLLSAVGAVILVSAAVDHLVFDRYATFGDALWSAVRHLLDPSSLQDDEGTAERTIGLFQVITAPVISQLAGRSAYRSGGVRRDLLVVDQLAGKLPRDGAS